ALSGSGDRVASGGDKSLFNSSRSVLVLSRSFFSLLLRRSRNSLFSSGDRRSSSTRHTRLIVSDILRIFLLRSLSGNIGCAEMSFAVLYNELICATYRFLASVHLSTHFAARNAAIT